MRKAMVFLPLLGSVVVAAAGAAAAQTSEEQQKPGISVVSMGKVTAKPDMAIVFLSARSSAPLAADALEQNKKKVQEVKARVKALGYKDEQIRFAGDRFAPSGQGMYYPGGQSPTGFDVYNDIFVQLEGTDLKDMNQFNTKVSALLDELSKLGASPSSMAISRFSMGGTSLVGFTVKDAGPYEKEAYMQAMERARPIAEDIARRMKAQITGVQSVVSTPMSRAGMQYGPAGTLDEIPYEYLSSSMDEVPVRVRVDVRYSYK
jgi:uncharacterized protein YggE